MSDESVLDYIQSHVEDLLEDLETNADRSDYEYYEGAIEALEHILAKFGRE